MIAVRAGTILIDERLCDPSKLGRLRFTCAHELAHWVLHKKLYSGNKWLGDQAKPSHRELLRVAIDNALSQSPANFEELLRLLQESGCEVSKRGKSYRLKLPGWEKAARMDSLGEGYGLDDLQAVLSGKKAHTPRKKIVTQAETQKVNLLVDIQAKLQAGKGAGYARWANLVFCSSNGRPMESQVINRAFNKLIKENGLPHVVFHSLRHSSITYKLKLNGGDMKSVQGDSGHAQVKMVADVYSHIIDEDRCINAQRLEEAFYSSKTPDPVEDTEPKTADTAVTESDESDAAKILELLKNPETAALLKQLAKAL